MEVKNVGLFQKGIAEIQSLALMILFNCPIKSYIINLKKFSFRFEESHPKLLKSIGKFQITIYWGGRCG